MSKYSTKIADAIQEFSMTMTGTTRSVRKKAPSTSRCPRTADSTR